jgi:Domain of unknown function (DUF1707)
LRHQDGDQILCDLPGTGQVLAGQPGPRQNRSMSDFDDATAGSGDPAAAAKRIGNGEREAAVAALKVHHTEGRLDSREYEDRSLQARQARTWADLDPLFADLPQPRPVPGAVPPVSAPTPVAPQPVAGSTPSQPSGPVSPQDNGNLIPEPWAAWVMSLTPFAALILFFTTGDWWWFLGIPIAGIVIYGPDGRHGSRNRNRNRNRRNRG